MLSRVIIKTTRRAKTNKREMFKVLVHGTSKDSPLHSQGFFIKQQLCKRQTAEQCLSQDLKNWVPKIGNCNIFGRPNFEGGPQYTRISTINMYKFIKIRHVILI